MKPKVVIDGLSLLGSLTGIGRYTYEISQSLQNFEKFNIKYFYGYYSHKLITPSSSQEIKNLKSFIIKNAFLKKIVRKILFLVSKIFGDTYDLYWQPSFIPNDGIKAKKIVTTVHDFSFVLHEDFHPKERIEYFKKYFFKNIMNSDMIITGSNFSKQEILDRLEIEEKRVKVIYHGINHNLFKVYDDLAVSFYLPEKFIFSVGSIEPRKNLLGLLQAYHKLNVSLKKEYKLVLAGFKGWENREIMDIINQNKDYIIYLGYISDKELAKTYNLASLFVYPSFYEGFGLPILESMACGTPVVCSSTTSMPEVGGDAVIYCKPDNINDIKEKIEIVLRDEKLQQDMREKGLFRAKLFTWEKSAQEHLKVFEEVLQS